MNYIKINRLANLQKILTSPIYLEREIAQSRQDILENTWGIAFSNNLVKKLQITDLSRFVLDLIRHRTEQLCEMNLGINATLYIWFDELALRLCFNVLSGENIELPFYCTLNIVDSYEIILQKYFNAAHENLHGNYYQILAVRERDSEGNMPSWNYEDKEEDNYVLDVWFTTLHCDKSI